MISFHQTLMSQKQLDHKLLIIKYHCSMNNVSLGKSLSSKMVVLSLINGMIGGLILILPLLALKTGYLATLIIIVTTGIFSFYSCHLCMLHIGNEPDLDSSILKHFNGNTWIRIFYDLCVWSNLLLIDILYFELIIIQWIGLAPPHQFSNLNAIGNALVLFVIVIAMKYYQFGANLMAYGIISIVSYVIFLGWVISSEQVGQNSRQFKPFGSGTVQLAAAMGQAFSLQSFFIPILKKNNDHQRYIKYVQFAYVIGGLAYLYIAFVGSYGIFYRDYLGTNQGQLTIQGYFGAGTWQVNLIQMIYLLHLYSVFPEFLLISKRRMFNVLKLPQTPVGSVNKQEILYVLLAIGSCLVISLFRVSIRDIIDLNGAVVGCIFIYFIPATLHIKCLYFSKGKLPISKQTKQKQDNKYEVMVEQGMIELENNKQNLPGSGNKNTNTQSQENGKDKEDIKEGQTNIAKLKQQVPLDQFSKYQCDCRKQQYSTPQKWIDGLMISSMVVLGAFIMIDGVFDLFQS